VDCRSQLLVAVPLPECFSLPFLRSCSRVRACFELRIPCVLFLLYGAALFPCPFSKDEMPPMPENVSQHVLRSLVPSLCTLPLYCSALFPGPSPRMRCPPCRRTSSQPVEDFLRLCFRRVSGNPVNARAVCITVVHQYCGSSHRHAVHSTAVTVIRCGTAELEGSSSNLPFAGCQGEPRRGGPSEAPQNDPC